MKTFVVLARSIVLVSILFCPMVMAFPAMPDDVQIVQPDPSLPKELSAFFGKWETTGAPAQLFVIVEKIDEEKASLYVLHSGGQANWFEGTPAGWQRLETKVIKERGKYKLWYNARVGNVEYTLQGEYLTVSYPSRSHRLRRVPYIGRASHRAGIQRQGQKWLYLFCLFPSVIISFQGYPRTNSNRCYPHRVYDSFLLSYRIRLVALLFDSFFGNSHLRQEPPHT